MTAPTVGAAGIGSSVAGGLLSAFGSYSAGQSQKQMYDYQAQVAKINANIDRQNSQWAYTQGETEATNFGMKASQQFGQIRAAQGASNIDVNTGSNALVQSSQRQLTSIDLGQIRANAAKTAYDYTVKATSDENQATLDTLAGKNAEKAGEIGAFSSILGSVSSVSTKWLAGKQQGLFA